MEPLGISRIATRVAASFAVLLALSIPLGYFAISYQYRLGTMEAEAEINARLVSSLISNNPQLWRFEQVRLEELLARRPHSGSPEVRTLMDRQGELIAENGPRLRRPLVTTRYQLMDSGNPVGWIVISQSLAPLLERTLVAALVGLLSGLAVFRIVPFREIVRAHKKLEDSNSFLSTVMESSTNALVVLDIRGCVVFANRRSQELLGLPAERSKGRLVGDLLSVEAREKMEAALGEIAYGGAKSVSFETVLFRSERDQLELSCGVAPFSMEEKQAGYVLCAEDFTNRKNAEERLKCAALELEESNAELKNFAYIISHDLRAPLVNIRGFSAELDEGVRELGDLFRPLGEHLDEKRRSRLTQLLEQDVPEALDFIGSSVLRMDRLITAVLKLSRLGHRELKIEPVQVGDLVSGILKSMSHQIEEHDATVCIGELPEVDGDRIALEQILGNLLDNAVKYLDPQRPGRLEIFAESTPGEVVIHVRDNGRGIAPQDQERVFEIFRRAGKQDVQGEGMGLAYVKTLLRSMRGQIWCQSEPGVGSTFSFSIPQARLAAWDEGEPGFKGAGAAG